MIGLALSGGGSRAIAFHLGCLRALNDLDLLTRLGVLSAISGGAVIGAYYAYTPEKSFSEFEDGVQRFLATGFETAILRQLRRPSNLIYSLRNIGAATWDAATERIAGRHAAFRGYPSRTDIFRRVLDRELFAGVKMSSPRRNGLSIVIGACELRTGTAFRFGDTKTTCWKLGTLAEESVDVALATAASAAYPIVLPALDRNWNFVKDGVTRKHRVVLTDGGVYDNLGLQVLEPGRDPTISLHTFPCEYLIVCNAGTGESLEHAPVRFLPRVARSFAVVHRRVQDRAMNYLHLLRETGKIRGFAMPYLGQQDASLPWLPSPFVSRSEVFDYPTDFKAMSPEWIDKLSARGEQLTRLLVSSYLRPLVDRL